MDDEEFQQQLLMRIGEVLHYVWDPVGVRDVPEARNEYESYADSVWRAVLEGKSKEEISEKLSAIMTERMGHDEPHKAHNDMVAELVLDWARFLRQPYE